MVMSYCLSAAQQVGSVKMKIDLDSVSVDLDGNPLSLDSIGLALTADNWTTVTVVAGEHLFQFSHPQHDPISRRVMVAEGVEAVLDIQFLPNPPTDQPAPAEDTVWADTATLVVTSTPDSASIYLNNRELLKPTPFTLDVSTGAHVLELFKEGYEPLAHRIEVASNQSASLNFLLKTLPPPPVTADQLDMELQKTQPMLNIEEAKKVRQWWNGLAETFLIVPLGQGLLAKALLDDDSQKEANVLVIAGVGMTTGSYLLGKILSVRKHNQIIRRNEEIVVANDAARQHNSDVTRIVKSTNEEAIERWLEENKRKGKVRVTVD